MRLQIYNAALNDSAHFAVVADHESDRQPSACALHGTLKYTVLHTVRNVLLIL